MNQITPHNYTDFRNRFHQFYDSLIEEVRFNFNTPIDERLCCINLTARDSHNDDDWVSIRLELKGIQDFCITGEKNIDYKVLYDGLDIEFIDEKILINFIPDYESDNTKISTFYLISSSATWIKPEK